MFVRSASRRHALWLFDISSTRRIKSSPDPACVKSHADSKYRCFYVRVPYAQVRVELTVGDSGSSTGNQTRTNKKSRAAPFACALRSSMFVPRCLLGSWLLRLTCPKSALLGATLRRVDAPKHSDGCSQDFDSRSVRRVGLGVESWLDVLIFVL